MFLKLVEMEKGLIQVKCDKEQWKNWLSKYIMTKMKRVT